MILRARIRNQAAHDQLDWIRVEAPDYQAARAMIDQQTPEGWQRLHLITGDPEPEAI